MEIIDEDDAKDIKVEELDELDYTQEEFEKMLEKMSNPVTYQKEIAVKIKKYLDKRMKEELEEEGVLGELTRRWVDQFNKICESIQKEIYGTKNVNLNFHRISHGDIAQKIKEAEEYVIVGPPDENRKSKRRADTKDQR